ncbi:prepilin-type N-terminal cleavage/methylation domain-containing protein [Phragmitibacter flavus]|uniref:Prepilin-type N-terminal cleavage/methylation domain-containing protein n=1 Tax=Phragmitibacter flavus TaxID=2576071 RepID=A0A5R8K9A1_9BACT|nr:prepilin-type N-terminal cleavage/methylation domain-containing protein [Phragmitibacter flavus]TLD68888.1 prepilin-type N-terminal cleavage/methylation domain-containing protein [Phragmitibacter flavus]
MLAKPSTLLKKKRRPGFTLVEVSLAIAVAGISLFSVIGLLPTLLENDEKSGANSILPTLATQAVAEVKRKIAEDGLPVSLDTHLNEKTAPDYTFHFSADGLRTEKDDINTVFECNLSMSRMVPLASNATGLTLPDPGDHCLAARMIFHWPATSPPNPQRTKTFHSTITDD